MFQCDEIGIKGLTDKLGENSITLREIQARSIEEVKKAAFADLADELQGTEADHELTTAIEECQKNLRAVDFYEKLRNNFTLHLRNPHKFKRKGMASREQVRKFLEGAMSVFPVGFIGEKNSMLLIDSVLNAVVSWKPTTPLKISTKGLRVLECDSCRALRSRLTRLQREVSVIQRELLSRITEFLIRLLLKTLLECAYFYAINLKSDYMIYDKRSFKHWRETEKNKFLRDYKVELAARNGTATSYYVLGKSLCRPTVMCILQGSTSHRNEMRVLAACLDGYILATGFKPHGGISIEVARLQRFFKCHILRQQLFKNSLRSAKCTALLQRGPLFFAKADIENCFACVNRELLKRALMMVMRGRTLVAVCGYGKTPSNTYRRVDQAATTYEGAVQSMLKSMKKKKLKCTSDVPAHTEVIPACEVLGRIMRLLDGIRLSLDRSDILYQMKHGVPQGFELSSRLAHIYLLHFENTYWPHLSKSTCLLRYVDDYLICSYSRAEVKKMLKTLLTKNEFGISARLSKCAASFRLRRIQRARRFIKWCGWIIDTKKKKVFKTRSDAQLLQSQHCFSGSEYARQRILRRSLAWEQEKSRISWQNSQ